MAACPDLPREPVRAQPWTVFLQPPRVAAKLAVLDPEVRSLEKGPGFWPRQGMEVRSVRLPSAVMQRIHFETMSKPSEYCCGSHMAALFTCRGLSVTTLGWCELIGLISPSNTHCGYLWLLQGPCGYTSPWIEKDVLVQCPRYFGEIPQVLMLKTHSKAVSRARTGCESNQ